MHGRAVRIRYLPPAMARIFNTLRRRLLAKGKFSRYLRYAFGEIVLVVLGILIALSINNWNHNRHLLQEEQEILRNLYDEFTYNAEELARNKEKGLRYIANADSLLAAFADPGVLPSSDAFRRWMLRMAAYTSFDPSNGVVRDLIGSGKLHLIRNDALRIRLANWDGHVQDVKEDEARLMQTGDRYFVPIRLEAIHMHAASHLPGQQAAFFSSLKNENVIATLRGHMRYIVEENYAMLDKEINDILDSLQSESQ